VLGDPRRINLFRRLLVTRPNQLQHSWS